MQNPKVIGRGEFDDEDDRSSTIHVRTVTERFEGGAVGALNISVFKSSSNEDRGGLVVRITIEDQGSSFLPTTRRIPNGIEVHMAGDIEARSLVKALRIVLTEL